MAGQFPRPGRKLRTGFTLIEMLISMAISLVIVYAMVEFMKWTGDVVTDGRAMIEMAGQLRGVRQRLSEDLGSLTVPVRPWADTGGGQGYFEYREGPRTDADADGNGTLDSSRATATSPYNIELQGGNTLMSDSDDIAAFTARSSIEPYIGRYGSGTSPNTPAISQVAEIIWWSGYEDKDNDGVWDVNEPRFIYRRVLLIKPELNNANGLPVAAVANMAAAQTALLNFWQDNDISARIVRNNSSGQYEIWANSLSDLGRRENRFAHQWTAGSFPSAKENFPSRWDLNPDVADDAGKVRSKYALAGGRVGEDVMIARVMGFDVQIFDPTAMIVSLQSDTNNNALTPIDPAYSSNLANVNEIGRGAYVNLGYTTTSGSTFSGIPSTKSQMGNTNFNYDTWSTTYENDGVDQDNDGIVDEGTDGLDNDNTNGVDDVAERETAPPYPSPVRGIKVIIRVYDPDTRQQRQATVAADFTPE